MEYTYPNINPHSLDPNLCNIAVFGSMPTKLFTEIRSAKHVHVYRCGYVFDTPANRQKRLWWTIDILGMANVLVVSGPITVEEALALSFFRGKHKYYLCLTELHKDYYYALGFTPYFTTDELIEKITNECN
jgi:hypothetical protein